MDDSIIRIMVSTDNHLGFMEKDPVRCNDSFAAFEEVCNVTAYIEIRALIISLSLSLLAGFCERQGREG